MTASLNGILSAIATMPDLSRGRCIGLWDTWEAIDDPAAAAMNGAKS